MLPKLLTNVFTIPPRLFVVILSLSISPSANNHCVAQDPPADGRETLPPIAVSGETEVDQIVIERRRASDQHKNADLTNMTVSLWLASSERVPERMLIQLTELDPIVDSEGKVLATKERLTALPFLYQEARNTRFTAKRGKQGPEIDLLLEAPAREATTIQRIKGKAILATIELVEIELEDLLQLNGKSLEDPRLEKFPISLEMEFADGQTEVTLKVPVNHARLAGWSLLNKSRRPPRQRSEGVRGQEGDRILQTKIYAGDQTSGTSLSIMLGETVSTREVAFDFQDVELP